MRFRPVASICLLLASALLLTVLTTGAAKDMKFEAQLIWATTSDTSPDPNHKSVDEETRKKLSELPLKWKHYFLVRKVDFSLPEKGSKEVVLSDRCKILVKQIDGKNFEVGLVGKGESILKRTQTLDKGNMLVLGGNAPESTGWLVTLKRVD
jgi:hypothetical protein